MKLLDQFGTPIAASDIARLREPQAHPTLTGVRQVISGSPADGMTPRRLAAIHRAAGEGDSHAYMELAEDIEERDLHYLAVLGTRKRQVSQLPIQVEAVSDNAEHVAHADFLREWIKAGILENALFDMLDAIGKGFSVMEIEWDVTPTAILPRELVYRSPRWFEVSRADGETLMLRDLAMPAWTPLTAIAGGSSAGTPWLPTSPLEGFLDQANLVPLLPHKFVVHRHKAKSGILARSGLARVASWAWMYKAFTLRDWAVFVQNYGMPIRLGLYGPESTQEERDVLWSAVANLAGDCAAIIPKSMQIEFAKMEGAMAAAEIYQKRADWFDHQVSKAVLGQTTTTDAISGGHAVAKEHRLVQEDIERADSRALSVTVTRQLGAAMIAFNFPDYVAGGGARFPKILIGRPDEMPMTEVQEIMRWMGPQGLTIGASAVRDRMGFDDPDDDEDVIGGKPPPPQPIVSPPQVTTVKEPGRGPSPAPGEPVETHSMRARVASSAAVDPELLDRLTQRMELDAQGALAGLTDQVRAEIEAAADLPDLMQRLDALKLDPAAFQLAMQRGMAVAHLAGQAALLDELRGR